VIPYASYITNSEKECYKLYFNMPHPVTIPMGLITKRDVYCIYNHQTSAIRYYESDLKTNEYEVLGHIHLRTHSNRKIDDPGYIDD
jgi:hypothetical protein